MYLFPPPSKAQCHNTEVYVILLIIPVGLSVNAEGADRGRCQPLITCVRERWLSNDIFMLGSVMSVP